MKDIETTIRREAARLLAAGTTAAAFSERFFGKSGLLGRLWQSTDERRTVVASPLYRWLRSRMADLRQREVEAFEEEIAGLSGRLTVVVPRSLHAALKREAELEGISLSELIRLKLGVAYRESAGLLGGRAVPAKRIRRRAVS